MCESSFKVLKIVKLEMAVLFYSIGYYVIACFIWHIDTVNYLSFRNAVLPSLTNLGTEYWFVPCYFAVVLVSPFLNKMLETLEQTQLRKLLLILLLFISIIPTVLQSVSWYDGNIALFIFLYFIGAYLKKYPEEFERGRKIKWFFFGIVLWAILIFLVCFLKINADIFQNFAISADYLFYGNSIFIIMLSVIFMVLFARIQIKHSVWLNKIAGTTLGIYLIHDNIYARQYIWENIFHCSKYYESPRLMLHAGCCILIVFATGAIIEYLRSLLFRPLENYVGFKMRGNKERVF